MALLRSLFWLALFVAATFGFTVLFEHGPSNYQENARKEADFLAKMFSAKVEKKADTSDKLLR